MLVGWCYFRVVLLLANVALVINDEYNEENYQNNGEYYQNNGTESIFTDVIKNISRVNNILQDLIKNYEQLQKMYKTQSFEVDISTDSEIDEAYKNENIKHKTNSRTSSNATYPPIKKKFPGTAMLVSEEELETITEESNFLEDQNKLPLIQSLHAPEPVRINEEVKEDTEDDYKVKKRKHIDHKHSDEIRVPDYVFYDNVHPKTTTKKAQSKRTKSTYKKYKHNVHQRSKERDVETKDVQGNSRNVQKVVYTESFNQEKIWDEIVNKKPIELKTHRNILQQSKRGMRSRDDYWKKERPRKTALVILSKTKKRDQEVSEDASSISFSEDDKAINKELFKSSILREAYGDACLKVVVKKCHKALKLVIKTVCRNVNCKSELKEKFTELSKSGCIKEFKPANGNQTISNNTQTGGPFTDATRIGLEDCFPIMKSEISLRNVTPPLTEMNILRDRFERACQEASTEKCKNACHFAYKGTCESYDCSHSKKKAFEKGCNTQCKAAYKSKTSSKSTTSSDSDSDSDSCSDSDSDSSSDSDSDKDKS